METIVFRVFEVTWRLVGVLIVGGTFLTVLSDLQEKAFQSKKVGLTSMLKINEQLVGRIRN